MTIRKIQIRRGTTAEWAAANPVLLVGERGYDTTARRSKIGDGSTLWNSLEFLGSEQDTRIAANEEAVALRLVASNNLSDVADVPAARSNLGMGTAALQDAAEFATAAQGSAAATALQDASVFATAAQGALSDTALQDAAAFATAAQGALADTATQPGDLGTASAQNSSAFATAAQGALADTALQDPAVFATN